MPTMTHIVEVDQSNKVEQSGPTVIAFANGLEHAVVIPSKTKAAAFRALRDRGKTKSESILIIFAAGLYFLLENHLAQLWQVTIDIEYTRHSANIKASLLRFIRRKDPSFPSQKIVFRRVGKGSPADQKAREVREGRDQEYRTITVGEMLPVLA